MVRGVSDESVESSTADTVTVWGMLQLVLSNVSDAPVVIVHFVVSLLDTANVTSPCGAALNRTS